MYGIVSENVQYNSTLHVTCFNRFLCRLYVLNFKLKNVLFRKFKILKNYIKIYNVKIKYIHGPSHELCKKNYCKKKFVLPHEPQEKRNNLFLFLK